MTTTTKTPAKKRTSRAKPKPAETVEKESHDSTLDSSTQDDLGGAHPDGEAELERLEAQFNFEEKADSMPEYADEPQPEDAGQGWSAIQSAGLLQMAFAAIAAGRGAHWVLEVQESVMLGSSLDAVLDKYFPDGPGQYGPEIALFASVVMIVAPRLALDVKKAANDENAPVNDEPKEDDELSSQAS